MDPSNRPQTISAQEFGLRHMQALQRLRDETLLVFSALEKAPQADLEQSFRDLPRLVKAALPEFPAEYERAKSSLAINALRRVLQMNSLFLERIFSENKSRNTYESGAAEQSRTPRPNIFQIFRDKLKQAGASEVPAATLASLATLERLLHENLAGPDSKNPKPAPVEVLLVEMDANSAAEDSPSSLKAKPWQLKLENGVKPEVSARLLESIFSTSIVVAQEGLQAGEKLYSKKNT